MKKALYLLLIVTTISVLNYAYDPTNSSRKNYISEFEIDSLSLSVGKIITLFENYTDIEPISTSELADTLDLSTLGFKIKIEKVSYITASSHWAKSIINSAYADPIPAHSKSQISLISIYSNESIETESKTFDAGENLTAIFEVSLPYEEWKSPLKMIENMRYWFDYDPILFRINTGLKKTINQRFTFKITMDDGKVFELDSEKIIAE